VIKKEFNMTKHEIICVGCPLGCHVTLSVSDAGDVIGQEGNECKVGEKYVMKEYKFPERVFTGSIVLHNCSRGLLSVRTDKPINRDKIIECGKLTCIIDIKPPVKIGMIIAENILDTGANLIATSGIENYQDG
jgi:CxxC motif-containing protein